MHPVEAHRLAARCRGCDRLPCFGAGALDNRAALVRWWRLDDARVGIRWVCGRNKRISPTRFARRLSAGRADGPGLFGLYRHIVFTLSILGFVVVLIWQFTEAHNDFPFAVVLTNNQTWPVTVALNNMAGSQISCSGTFRWRERC